MTLDFEPLNDYFRRINITWEGFSDKEINSFVDFFWSEEGPNLHDFIRSIEEDLKNRNQ